MNFFVTGGSRGIGESIVLEAIRQGHDVGFTYLNNETRAMQVIDSARLLNPGSRCRAYQLDVRSSAAVEEVGDRFMNDFRSIEVVVANAGINKNNLLVSMSDEDWDDVLRTNLTGTFYICRQFLPAMLANRFGRFVLMSSLGYSGVSGQANYCASKAGLHGLCSSMAKEIACQRLTGNSGSSSVRPAAPVSCGRSRTPSCFSHRRAHPSSTVRRFRLPEVWIGRHDLTSFSGVTIRCRACFRAEFQNHL